MKADIELIHSSWHLSVPITILNAPNNSDCVLLLGEVLTTLSLCQTSIPGHSATLLGSIQNLQIAYKELTQTNLDFGNLMELFPLPHLLMVSSLKCVITVCDRWKKSSMQTLKAMEKTIATCCCEGEVALLEDALIEKCNFLEDALTSYTELRTAGALVSSSTEQSSTTDQQQQQGNTCVEQFQENSLQRIADMLQQTNELRDACNTDARTLEKNSNDTTKVAGLSTIDDATTVIAKCQEKIKQLQHDCELVITSLPIVKKVIVVCCDVIKDRLVCGETLPGNAILHTIDQSVLATSRPLFATLFNLIFRKEQQLEEVDSLLRNAHVGLQFAVDVLDPLARKHADHKKELYQKRVQLETQLMQFKDTQSNIAQAIGPSVQALHGAGVQFADPMEEVLQALNAMKVELQSNKAALAELTLPPPSPTIVKCKQEVAALKEEVKALTQQFKESQEELLQLFKGTH
eukprot:TRINITY_DN47083_c0_g1_i1.p1 TRINITY_DN47083_c0_g1~~TRINITY_DN47083_c0_g1_i1.p1  ORF type:complete len:462 (+),score=54.24 TRINITY_DN47083_c0_g1_i1:53-1438(+)